MKTMILAFAVCLAGSGARAQSIEAARLSVENLLASAASVKVAVPVAAAAEAAPSQETLDRLFKADDEIVRLQTLLGQYVVGKTINGPVLRKAPVEIELGAEYKDVLALFPSLRQTVVDGRIRVRIGEDVAAEYGRLRAEFMARLPRLILLERVSGLGNDLSRGHLTWARGLQIVSQPECVELVGRVPWPGFCS